MDANEQGLVTQLARALERLESLSGRVAAQVVVDAGRGAIAGVALVGALADACTDARAALARATPEAVRKADAAPEILAIAQRRMDALDAAGNHFDHDNSVAAQDAIARYFELWAEDDRAAIAKAEGRS